MPVLSALRTPAPRDSAQPTIIRSASEISGKLLVNIFAELPNWVCLKESPEKGCKPFTGSKKSMMVSSGENAIVISVGDKHN